MSRLSDGALARGFRARVSPRVAGITGIVVAIAIAVAGGYLISRPPFSIPGALVLVVASILLSISAVWAGRRSWDQPWPPYVAPSLAKQIRRMRVLFVTTCVLLVAMIGLGVDAIVEREWGQLVLAAILTLTSGFNFVTHRRILRRLQALARDTIQPPPGTAPDT